MSYAKRVDENQNEIVRALRGIGATVYVASAVGGGFPDLVVGINRRNFLLEIKDGSKPPSRQCLTGEEAIFHNEWKGQVTIVRSVAEALAAVGAQLM